MDYREKREYIATGDDDDKMKDGWNVSSRSVPPELSVTEQYLDQCSPVLSVVTAPVVARCQYHSSTSRDNNITSDMIDTAADQ